MFTNIFRHIYLYNLFLSLVYTFYLFHFYIFFFLRLDTKRTDHFVKAFYKHLCSLLLLNSLSLMYLYKLSYRFQIFCLNYFYFWYNNQKHHFLMPYSLSLSLSLTAPTVLFIFVTSSFVFSCSICAYYTIYIVFCKHLFYFFKTLLIFYSISLLIHYYYITHPDKYQFPLPILLKVLRFLPS